MSNYFDLAQRELLKQNPAHADFSNLTAQLKQEAQDRAAIDKINNAARAKRNGDDQPANEHRKLSRELYNLTSRKSNTEIYANNQAAEVRLSESNLAALLSQKKAAIASGNVVAERNFEHSIAQLEHALISQEQEFHRARKAAAGAAAELKEWPHHTRLAELEKICA